MIEHLINLQPTTVTITRHSQVANEGGFSWDEEELDPITIRLYDYGHDAREYRDVHGETKLLTHGFLAERDADIIVSHSSYDTFQARGRTYRVYSVRFYDDVLVGPQLQCACGAV